MQGSRIDQAAVQQGFVFAAPKALDASICNCALWGGALTRLDPGSLIAQNVPAAQPPGNQSEVPFLFGMVACMAQVLKLPLSGDVFTAGFSQGAKIATQLGCENAAKRGLGRILNVIVRATFIYGPSYVDLDAGCAAKAPALLTLAAAEDIVTPLCNDTALARLQLLAPEVFFLRAWASSVSKCARELPSAAWCVPQTSSTTSSKSYNARAAFAWPGCSAPFGLLYISNSKDANGHAWPGRMPELGDRDATSLMLQFFSAVRSGARDVLNDLFTRPAGSWHACDVSKAWPCKS